MSDELEKFNQELWAEWEILVYKGGLAPIEVHINRILLGKTIDTIAAIKDGSHRLTRNIKFPI